MAERPPLLYADAGVDLDAAERAKGGLVGLLAATRDANTLSELGSFGGLYRVPGGLEAPILVSSADGVGTKLKVAFRTGRHDTIGQDLVNHCVNDILVQGARPLFFLDYLATGRLDEHVVQQVVGGVARACAGNRCALLGGETAQMPDFYSDGEYDLAGFIVGIVEAARLVDGRSVVPGDLLVALPSSGLHTNGYTLARRIVFGELGLTPEAPWPGGDDRVGDVLLAVHRSYLDSVLPEMTAGFVKAAAHVTGGGIPGNLPRSLPAGCGAVVERSTWTPGPLFEALADGGRVPEAEMFRVFNMGVGMILVVAPDQARGLVERLHGRGESAWICGEVTEGAGVEIR